MNNPKEVTLNIVDYKEWFVAFTNTDLTEGRGYEIPCAISTSRTAAERVGKGKYVMGGDCPISSVSIPVLEDGHLIVAPYLINLSQPTKEDLARDKKFAEIDAIKEKMRVAGLSEQDIAVISGKV